MGSNVGTTPTLTELTEARLAYEDERDPLERIRLGERLDATAGRSQLEDDLSTLLAEADRRDL